MVKLYKPKRGLKRYRRKVRVSYKPRISRKPANNGFAPLGYKQAVKLRYVETITVDPATGVVSDTVFSANGLYDPNVSGTGHQPYGFDQLMAMYNHYTVVGSKATLRAINNQSLLPAYFALLLRDSATSLTGSYTDVLMEQPGNRMKLTAPLGSQGPSIIRKTFSAKRFFSKNRGAIVEDSNLRGDVANNPLEQAFYHAIVAPNLTTDNLGTQSYQMVIDFYAVFTEPKILPQS